jgi:hypothetical protein
MEYLSVKNRARVKYGALLLALTSIHFVGEYMHYKLCASNVADFIMSRGSHMCIALRTVANMPMETFLGYIS